MKMYLVYAITILAEPFRNKTNKELIATFKKWKKELDKHGFPINLRILDNEAPGMYRDAIKESGSKFQMTSQSMRRKNAGERAVRTFKENFLVKLSGVDENFPMSI